MSSHGRPDLATLLRTRAEGDGDRVMAIFPADAQTLTYHELHDGSRRWLAEFTRIGLEPGARVTIVARKSRRFLAAYFGALLAGVTVHVVDEQIDAKDMQHALGIFTPDALVGDSFGERRMGEVDHDGELRDLVDFSDLPETDCEPPALAGETPAVCVFTSGSTGDPKGILSSHDNLVFAGGCLAVHELTPQDRVLGLTPLSGTNGQVFSVWAPIVSGGSAIFYQGMFNPFSALEWAEEHTATWINGTPTYLSLFLTHRVDPAEFDLGGVRFYRSASAPLPASVQQDFESHYGVPIVETMGLSEMSGQVFANPIDVDERKPGSVGRPYRSDLRIVDDDRQPVSPGAVGELEVRSPGLMLGYLDDPTATDEAIVDGWLRTGDLGATDEDGFVFIRGRKKDIAIVGGKNISLREVDDALYALPGVTLATCFGLPDELGGERIVAILQPGGATPTDEGAAHAALLKDSLTPHKRPAQIVYWDDLPLGGSGKVLRARAKARYLQLHDNQGT